MIYIRTIHNRLLTALEQDMANLGRREARPIGTAGWVANVIREAIFAGDLKPGTRLVEGKLAKELDVGISPVREGLQQLEHLGLVTRYPNRGTYITELSAGEVQQIYRLRAELETLSVKYALEKTERKGIADLQRCAEEMMQASKKGDYTGFFECDLQFHTLLCRIAEDPFLERCLLSLTTPLFAFVLIRLKQDPILFDFESISRSHQEIVDLLRLSDAQAAVEGMHRIMHGFRQEILGSLYGSSSTVTEENPEQAR